MKSKSQGRPVKGTSSLSKTTILEEALIILDTEGITALSYRSLAKNMEVTPMALTNHIGTKNDLLKSLVELVYFGINDSPLPSQPKEGIRFLLTDYCQRVLEHPNLTRLLLTDHSLMNTSLIQFTNLITQKVQSLVNNSSQSKIVSDLIIDYTHGFALSATAQKDQSLPSLTVNDFTKGLDWILVKL